MQVFDHSIQVEAFELCRVIKLLAHGIGQGGVLVKHFQVQLIRPPVRIRRAQDSMCLAPITGHSIRGYFWLCITGAGYASQYFFFFRHDSSFRLDEVVFEFFALQR